MLIRNMRYNPFHMADYNIKSQNTVLSYYLHKTNLDFVTLTYYGV